MILQCSKLLKPARNVFKELFSMEQKTARLSCGFQETFTILKEEPFQGYILAVGWLVDARVD